MPSGDSQPLIRLATPSSSASSSHAPTEIWLASSGYQPEFGARPLRRTIRAQLDRKLSRMLLAGELNPGDKVDVDVLDGGLRLAVSPRDLAPGLRQGPKDEGQRTAAPPEGSGEASG